MESCPKGQILRKGYTVHRKGSKKNYRVKSTCIKDRGLPGKGKKLFTLSSGALSKYGYSLKDSSNMRHHALNKAVKDTSYAEIMRRVNALSILMRNTEPKYYDKLISDKDYLQDYLGKYSKTFQRTGKSPKSRKRSGRRRSSKKKRRKSPRRKSKKIRRN